MKRLILFIGMQLAFLVSWLGFIGLFVKAEMYAFALLWAVCEPMALWVIGHALDEEFARKVDK